MLATSFPNCQHIEKAGEVLEEKRKISEGISCGEDVDIAPSPAWYQKKLFGTLTHSCSMGDFDHWLEKGRGT